MKKFAAGLVKKRGGTEAGAEAADGTPEERATRGVRLFCESGAPNSSNGETQEYLHLPTIVEAAESTPSAAKAAAHQIRKLLKENYQKPFIQYNAIMLIRILSDNPGKSFTQNIDEKFRTTIQTLLQKGNDPSVQQLLMETLYALETEKAYDDNLIPLMAMWRKERSTILQRQSMAAQPGPMQWGPNIAGSSRPPRPHRQRTERKLPSPAELSGRIEEGRMSAQVLTQVTQSTSPAELLKSSLAREFAERCQTAQLNLQGYMNCTDPAPDEHTFQTLIECCEQLSVAMSKHQRALLAARRLTGQISPPATDSQIASPDIAMSAPGVQSLSRETPAPTAPTRNPYLTNANTLFPSTTTTTSPRDPVNPFSDDNKINSRSISTQNIDFGARSTEASRQQGSTGLGGPASESVELPLSSTPPPGATLPGPVSSLPPRQLVHEEDDFQPPPGPPPNRTSTAPPPPQLQPELQSQRPVTPESDDLYSANSPVRDKLTSVHDAPQRGTWPAEESTYVPSPTSPSRSAAQYQNGTLPAAESGASNNPFIAATVPPTPPANAGAAYFRGAQPSSPPASPPRLQPSAAVGSSDQSAAPGSYAPRIRDDEPMTPMSPGAWQSSTY